MKARLLFFFERRTWPERINHNETGVILFFAAKNHIHQCVIVKDTQRTSAREILRNSTFPRQTANREMSSCELGMDLSSENRCNQEKPSIMSNGVMLGFFFVVFRVFLS